MRHHRPKALRAGLTAVALCAPLLVSIHVTPATAAAAATSEASAPADQPTTVDTSFGGGFTSHHLSDIDDQAAAVALQPDGAVVVVGKTNTESFDNTPGDIFVARFTAAGALDPTFGSGGVAVIGAPGQWDWATALAIQDDGKIVVAGDINEQPTILRLTPTGAPDPDFQQATIPSPYGGNTYVDAVVIQPKDGKIVYTGAPIAVGRLNPDGAPDTTFGTNGLTASQIIPDFNWETTYRAVVLQPDGKIVVGGSGNGAAYAGPVEVASLARYTTDGALDPTFGSGGLVTTNLDTNYVDRGTKISALALQPDGRIVAAGEAYSWAAQGVPHPGTTPTYGPILNISFTYVTVFRYLPDGSLDTDFAGKGVVISELTSEVGQTDLPGSTSVPAADSRGFAVSLAPDGAILVAGALYEVRFHPLVLRYTASGLLDTTFGPDGKFVVGLGDVSGEGAAMAMQPDGRLVVVGATRTNNLNQRGSYSDVMVGRVNPGTRAGTVWTWGWNAMGQLGDGTTTDRHTPAPVPGLSGVVAVSAGAYHTLALRGDGTVWAWGYNAVGELGDGTTVNRLRPVRVPGLTGVVAVSAGGVHSLALRGDGTVWAWGYNGFGELGDGTTVTRLAPVQVPGLQGIRDISAGLYHSFATREDGGSLGWGYNAVGQLSDGTNVDQHSPVWLPLMQSHYAFQRLSAGALHTLAVDVTGSVQVSGWNGYAQIGDPRQAVFVAPIQPTNGGAAASSAGWYHSLLLQRDGSVLSGGWNAQGQLGDGTTTTHQWGAVPGLTGVVAVSAGGVHSLAITQGRRLLAWGWNGLGELGTGSTVDGHTPVAVGALSNVVAVSAGFVHSVAITG